MNVHRSVRPQFGRAAVDVEAIGSVALEGPESFDHSCEAIAPLVALVPPLVALVPPQVEPLRRRAGWRPKVVQGGADVLAVVAGLWVAYGLRMRLPALAGPAPVHSYIVVGALSLPLWVVVMARYRLFSARHVQRVAAELNRLAHATAAGVAATALVAVVTGTDVARSWIVLSLLTVTCTLAAERTMARAVFDRLRRSGRLVRRILVIGTDAAAAALVATLDRSPKLGYEVAGFLDDRLSVGTRLAGDRLVLGRVADAAAVVRSTRAQGVLIVPSALGPDEVNTTARALAEVGVHVEVLSTLRGIAPERLTVGAIGTQFGVLYVEPVARAGWRPIAKRVFDVGFAAAALLAASPVLAVFAIAIRLDSRGPAFFRQRRLGRDGETFEVLKLRSMVVGAEARLGDLQHLNEADGPLFKVRLDPRVTRIGRIVRCMSLDELPQFWNVIRGEMSIVGPRPALPAEANEWSPELHQRLRVRPGITGMWQVNSRGGASFDDYVELDLYYVENWSLLMDVQIVLRTVPSVLLHRGAH